MVCIISVHVCRRGLIIFFSLSMLESYLLQDGVAQLNCRAHMRLWCDLESDANSKTRFQHVYSSERVQSHAIRRILCCLVQTFPKSWQLQGVCCRAASNKEQTTTESKHIYRPGSGLPSASTRSTNDLSSICSLTT